MKIRHIYQKLHEFIVVSLNYDNEKVIFSNQINNVRPLKPFITISISSFKKLGTPIFKQLDNSDKRVMIMPMLCNVTIQSFSDKWQHSEELLTELQLQLFSNLSDDIFRGEMAVRRILKPVSLLDFTFNKQREIRAIFEFEIGFNSKMINKTEFIETVLTDSQFIKK